MKKKGLNEMEKTENRLTAWRYFYLNLLSTSNPQIQLLRYLKAPWQPLSFSHSLHTWEITGDFAYFTVSNKTIHKKQEQRQYETLWNGLANIKQLSEFTVMCTLTN